MAATLTPMLLAYDIPSGALIWQNYLRELLSVEHQLEIDGGTLPSVPYLTTTSVVDTLALGMHAPSNPEITPTPSLFDFIHNSTLVPLINAMYVWALETFPPPLITPVTPMVSSLGNLGPYIINAKPKTIWELENLITDWMETVTFSYTIVGPPPVVHTVKIIPV